MTSVAEILHAIELADDTLTLVDIALSNNPSPDDERALRRQKLRLEAERAVLEAELDAALDGNAAAQGPSAAQLAEVLNLVQAVEAATHQRAVAGNVLGLASKSLALITDLVKD
jgi:hypothetical protein